MPTFNPPGAISPSVSAGGGSPLGGIDADVIYLGARGGALDDGPNIRAAVATGKSVFLLSTNYNYGGAGIQLLTAQVFAGVSWVRTTIKPLASFAGTLLSGAGSSIIERLSLDGSLTTDCIGFKPFSRNSIRNVSVHHFGGASGIGVDVLAIVGGSWDNLNTEFSTLNARFGFGDSNPTTIHLSSFRCASAIAKGVQFLSGQGIVFTVPTFESNGEEGFYLNNATASAEVDCSLDHPWFEQNWTTLAGAARHAKYHLFADCTDAAPKKARISVDTYRAGDGIAPDGPRAMRLKNCRDYLIDRPLVRGINEEISIEGSATGNIVNYPSDFAGSYTARVTPAATVAQVIPSIAITDANSSNGAINSLAPDVVICPPGDTTLFSMVAGATYELTASVSAAGAFWVGYVYVPLGTAAGFAKNIDAQVLGTNQIQVIGLDVQFHNATGGNLSVVWRARRLS